MPLRRHSATICDVQLSDGIVHKFHNILLFMKMYLPPTFILGYVRPKMIEHAVMTEPGQPGHVFHMLSTIFCCCNVCFVFC